MSFCNANHQVHKPIPRRSRADSDRRLAGEHGGIGGKTISVSVTKPWPYSDDKNAMWLSKRGAKICAMSMEISPTDLLILTIAILELGF